LYQKLLILGQIQQGVCYFGHSV